jgi:hypothetical protein
MDLLVLYVGLFDLWLGQFMINVEEISNGFCKLVKFLGYFCSDLSVWLIVAVTIERTVVVLFPLKARLCNARTSRLCIYILMLIFLLVNCHFLWSVNLQHFSYNSSIISKCQAKIGYIYIVDIIWPWVDAVIYSFLPFAIILILNSLIIKNLITAKKRRNDLRQHSLLLSKDPQQMPGSVMSHKITCMLLVISFVFLVTTLPMAIVLIHTSLADSVVDDSTLTRRILIYSIAEMLMYLNHSINFFLYYATGSIELCRNDTRRQPRKESLKTQKLLHLNAIESLSSHE